jgi:hypothetical protein
MRRHASELHNAGPDWLALPTCDPVNIIVQDADFSNVVELPRCCRRRCIQESSITASALEEPRPVHSFPFVKDVSLLENHACFIDSFYCGHAALRATLLDCLSVLLSALNTECTSGPRYPSALDTE